MFTCENYKFLRWILTRLNKIKKLREWENSFFIFPFLARCPLFSSSFLYCENFSAKRKEVNFSFLDFFHSRLLSIKSFVPRLSLTCELIIFARVIVMSIGSFWVRTLIKIISRSFSHYVTPFKYNCENNIVKINNKINFKFISRNYIQIIARDWQKQRKYFSVLTEYANNY